MKIVVTGATGLIGSCLVKKLLECSENKVVAVSRNKKKLEELFSDYIHSENFDYCTQDFSENFDFKLLSSHKFTEDTDLIFHAAGPISGEIIKNDPLSVIRPNINALQLLLNYATELKNNKKNIRLVVFSSATVYGNQTCSDISVTEENSYQADSLDFYNAAYSESKRMAEVITKAYVRQNQIDAVIVRPSYVYGNSFFKPNTAFYSFLEKAQNNENIVMNKSGLPRRDNIYIEDIVSGLITVAEKGICGESYNISSDGYEGNFASIDEIAQMIANISNEKFAKNIKVQFKEEIKNTRLPGIKLNCDKLKSLGWAPKYSLKNGIEETLKTYFKEN